MKSMCSWLNDSNWTEEDERAAQGHDFEPMMTIDKSDLPLELQYVCVAKSGCSWIGPKPENFQGESLIKLEKDFMVVYKLGLPFSWTYMSELDFKKKE